MGLLIKCSITDDWSFVMMDLAKGKHECSEERRDCGSAYAYPYFIIF
jgi:hypothetical protein